ncbi:hypothetical protein GW17_00052848 [Ensete ventricosum]|nr:hypothetical protein GW17_00052848 [Ensete ventricosum]
MKRSYRSDMDPGSSLGIGVRFGQCGGSSPGVHLDFAEGIGKIARNMPGDRQRKTMRLAVRNARGCSIAGGLVFTQRRSVVDVGVPQGGLRSKRRGSQPRPCPLQGRPQGAMPAANLQGHCPSTWVVTSATGAIARLYGSRR